MNFKNNIERCETAQGMGYRVQFLTRARDEWLTQWCMFINHASQYRVHPDDVEAFEADLAAREGAARRQSEPPLADLTDNIAACKEAQAMGFRVQYHNIHHKWEDAYSPTSLSYTAAPDRYRVHPDDMEAYLKQRASGVNRTAASVPAPDPTEDTTTVDATSVETPDDSLEVLAKLLPLLGSLPGVSADITITLHIKV